MIQKLILIFVIFFSIFYFGVARAEEKPLISQVQITGGSGKTSDDFVEIFNPNNTPLNLKDYRLVKRTKNGSADTSLKSWAVDTYVPAKSFYLWANSGFTSIAVTPDATTSGSIANDNGVALRFGQEDTGVLVDSVAWGSANNGFRQVTSLNPTANQALLRTDLYNPTSDFSFVNSSPRNTLVGESGATTPTPSTAPLLPTNTTPPYLVKSAFVKITEILPNPPGEDTGKEEVELFNSGSGAVNLDGWYLDDKNSGSVKSTAWQISQVTIDPGEYLVLTIPKSKFVLNNSGGETVNLYFADKTLADSVSYGEDAKEELSYQLYQGVWVWSQPTLGKENFSQVFLAVNSNQIYLNEIFANPKGEDEGNEWVEIANSSDTTVSLKGFVLDNGVGNESIKENAMVLDEKYVLPKKSFLQVKIPEDKFLLSNSGDRVRLFDPSKKLLEVIDFSAVPEGQSYAKSQQGKWSFTFPSPNFNNDAVLPKNSVLISEILPSPNSEQDEFVELKNTTDTEVDLSGLALQIGNKFLKLTDKKIAPKSFLVIFEADLPGHLPNLGGTLTLVDTFGREISQVQYGSAKVGESFNLTTSGEYFWSSLVTPGKENEVILGEKISVGGLAVEKILTVSSKKIDKKAEEKILNENIELKKDILDLSNEVALLSQKIDVLSQNLNKQTPVAFAGQSASEVVEDQKNYASSPSKYLFISGLALVGLLAIGFKYAKNVL